VVDISPHSFHAPRYFMPERHWQRINRRDASAIVRIRMADPAGCDSDQDLGRADLWRRNLGIFQWFPELDQSNSSHGCWVVSRI
jgi:hypothetical protein